jgi:hypothetical protein
MEQDSLFEDFPRPDPKRYPLRDGGSVESASLSKSERDTQIEAMREWFLQNFEDPAQNTPYDSGEGGFQFIWGGPYDPQEQLSEEFGGIVPDEVIEELADELSDIAIEWSGNSNDSDSSDQFDEYLYGSVADSPVDGFVDSILNVKRLLEVKVDAAEYQCFLRLLYANVITALESYLSDRIKSSIKEDPALLRKLVETTPEFQRMKIPVSDIFKVSEEIEQKVKTHLSELVWHRLDKVSPMFRDVLGVEFPTDLKELYGAIVIRHDLVHRNGKTKEGEEHVLSQKIIEDLITNVERFVEQVEPPSHLDK